MNKTKYGIVAVMAAMLIAALLLWSTETKEKKAATKQPEIFLFQDQGNIQWFELTIQKDKLEGKLRQQIIIEEPGNVPLLE